MPQKLDNDQTNAARREEQYRTHIKPLLALAPSAAYIVRNDVDFTLVDGNEYFFDLIECSREELKHKYGYRLSALLEEESLKTTGQAIAQLQDNIPTCLQQRLKRGNKSGWALTTLTRIQSEIGPVLHCMSVDITDIKHHLFQSDTLNESFTFAAEQSGLAVFEYNPQTETAFVFGSSSLLPSHLVDDQGICTEFVERIIAEGVVCEEHEPTFRKALQMRKHGEERFSCELKMLNNIKKPAWGRLTVADIPDAAQEGGFIGVLEDITEQKESALDYLRETQFFQSMLSEQDAYGQIDVTEDRILHVGGMWNLYNEIIDKVTFTQLFEEFIDKVVHPDDRKHYRELLRCTNFIESLDNGIDRLGCEFRRIVNQNKMMWMQLSVHLFRDPLSRHVFGLLYIKNIDAKKRQEFALAHDATFDQLTDIYNRKAAQSSIVEYLRMVDKRESYAFMILDLDNFKTVNEAHGHNVGDQALIKLADALATLFRKNDIAGRFGGDEFILLMKGVSSEEWVAKRLEELIRILAEEEETQFLTCSIGIAYATGPSTYDHLFRKADIALYEAKNSGKGCYRFFDEESSGLIDRRKQLLDSDASTFEHIPDITDIQPFYTGSFESDTEGIASLVSTEGDIAYLVDVDSFDLICGNQAFYDRVGMTEKQCTGLKCYEIMHRRETPCPFCGKVNWARDKFFMWKNYNSILEQEFLIKNKLVTWNNQEVMLALAIDMSNNKSIVDSLDTGVMETHAVLEGVQRMTGSETLVEAVDNALESIGTFFRASTVRLWHRPETAEPYQCVNAWPKDAIVLNDDYQQEAARWIENLSWGNCIDLENPEAMLCHSYVMYQHMKTNDIRNQRWIRIMGGEGEPDCISIGGISSNFQNVSFLNSFCVFLKNELSKRSFTEKTMHAILHDDLTDLMSRRCFETFIFDFEPDPVSSVGVVVANFDNLKGINESRGFKTGNYYIMQFADMMREALGEYNLYRIDGDEFLAVAINEDKLALDRAVEVLEEKIKDSGLFTVSLGVAWDNIENDPSVLLEQATHAMQVNKKQHRDMYGKHEGVSHRRMLSELLASLEKGDFKAFLQPKVDLETRKVVGAEALIRFEDEIHGIIPPAKFIDLLEKNDLIRYIDMFVLEETCKLLEKWQRRNITLPVVSLNFSRFTLLERDIASSVEAIVSKYDISKKNIEIEITESAVVIGKSILYQAAHDLYSAGYSISLDDFGTKYTNLSILADIDFDMLKLDRSLINALEDQQKYRAILENVISMCDSLGIGVIAEGVETEAQAQILRELNCKYGQGYLYGKPMPALEFERTCLGLTDE